MSNRFTRSHPADQTKQGSNEGEAEILSPWQPERVGEGGNSMPPANQLGELFASSRNPGESEWGSRVKYTEKLNWEFSVQLTTLSHIVNTYVLIIL